MFANMDAGEAFWESDFLQQMSILCASQQHLQHGDSLALSFSFWAGSEIQNKPKQFARAGSFLVTTCESVCLWVLTVKRATEKKKRILEGFGCIRGVSSCVCTTPPGLHSEPGFFFFFCQAVGQEQTLVRQLRAFPSVPVPATACREDGTVGACSEAPRKMMWKRSRDCQKSEHPHLGDGLHYQCDSI